ncbi:MAG TPA: TldD/PmbA family protein [Pseudomonadales bacterium]|nr:TldD/PmbA family protein [Pseudomonadales bacterium]
MSVDIQALAGETLARMKSAGFDDAQVVLTISEQDELNMAHNEPSLLRSTEDYALSLTGLSGGRKATTRLTELDNDSIAHSITTLFERAQLAPVDEGNAVSEGQQSTFEQGPQEGDLDLLANKVEELLEFRRHNTPRMAIEEGAALHRRVRQQLLTSRGTSLACSVGSYGLTAMGTASEGGKSSSFNGAGGRANDIADKNAADYFGIADMLKETERQIETRPIDGNFVGDVIFAPGAVSDLLGWLIQQLGDGALLANASLYRTKVGEVVTAPILNIHSRFDAPGGAPFSDDGFVTPPLKLIEAGRLNMLLPSLYGSRKTGVAHTPFSSGWTIATGDIDKDAMIADVKRGAIVNRLSMGSPGPSGDFSSVIKNSFLIENGKVGAALAETMIAGNMAQMLRDITAISKQHIDDGTYDFPWIRVPNLHFS